MPPIAVLWDEIRLANERLALTKGPTVALELQKLQRQYKAARRLRVHINPNAEAGARIASPAGGAPDAHTPGPDEGKTPATGRAMVRHS